MTAPDVEVHGPIDFVLLEFGDVEPTGEMARALVDLVEQGTIAIYDLMVVRRDADGTITGVDLASLAGDEIGGLVALAGLRSGILGDEDLAEAAGVLAPGTTAALIVYENTWAIPFVAAARRAGGELVAGGRIPATTVMEVLDELEAADAAG